MLKMKMSEKKNQIIVNKKFLDISLLMIILTIVVQLTGCKSEINSQDIALIKKSVLKTNANWQLFVDDYWIADSTNITMTLHQPEKHPDNPLIRRDVPWEETPYCFGTVIYDEEEALFKIWYMSYNYGQSVSDRTPILYATSTDGIQWVRPSLGLFEFDGSKKNNIVLQNYGYHDLYSPSVIKDYAEPDSNRRYKMIWWDFPLGEEGYQDDGMCVAFSADGINWVKHTGNPVLHAKKGEQSISDVMSVIQDKNTGKFIAYAKGWADPWPSHRQIVRTESSDFIHWSEPEVIITHKHDIHDPQSYGMTPTQLGNNYFGLLHSYKKPGNETIDVQLVISHDNKNWTRVANQKTFIPLGEEGSWDDGMLFTTPPFNHGDKTLIYYSAWDGAHNTKTRSSGIGLATIRQNGFVSLDVKNFGNITTNIIKNAGGPLLVNVNAKEGSLRAELLDAQGNPIPGYTINDCISVKSNEISHWIQWSDHEKLPSKSEPIQIRFELNNASLYGFYAGSEAVRYDDN